MSKLARRLSPCHTFPRHLKFTHLTLTHLQPTQPHHNINTMCSPNLAEAINTANITTDVGAEDNPAPGAANISCIHEATDEATQTATAISPFFRLPRELRDEICELAALSEHKLYCEIALRAEAPPQKTFHAGCDAHRAFPNSQFEFEYAAAVERRVKSLQAGSDLNGFKLWPPGLLEYVVKTRGQRMVKAEEVWLEYSEGLGEDGHAGFNIHAIALVLPLSGTTAGDLERSATFKFQFPDKAELGPRLRLDCYWERREWEVKDSLHFHSDDGSVVQRVLGMAKEVNWKGSVREYMLWQRYILKYVHRGPSPSYLMSRLAENCKD